MFANTCGRILLNISNIPLQSEAVGMRTHRLIPPLNVYDRLCGKPKKDVEQMDNGTSYRGGMCVEV